MSVQLSESMKRLSPSTISPPMSPSVATFCSTQSAALLMTPWLSSTWVISAPPGTSSMSARRKFAAVRSVRAHVDRVEPEHQRQHPEAGDVVRLVGEVVERVLHAEPLDGGRRAGRGHSWPAPPRAAPRARRCSARWTVAPCWIVWVSSWASRWRPVVGARLVLVAPEEDVVAVGERPGAEVVAQAGGALVGVHADVAEVGAEPRLHERRARRAVSAWPPVVARWISALGVGGDVGVPSPNRWTAARRRRAGPAVAGAAVPRPLADRSASA